MLVFSSISLVFMTAANKIIPITIKVRIPPCALVMTYSPLILLTLEYEKILNLESKLGIKFFKYN